MQSMLIESPSHTTPPPVHHQNSMVSSPGKYDIFERLKRRVGGYRGQHQYSVQRHCNTLDQQTLKSAQETSRLQQQFLNNNHAKSKQTKSSNANGTVRTNKRGNSSLNADGETKTNKLPKIAPTTPSTIKMSSSPSYRNSNACVNSSFTHSPSTPVDIKPKPSITSPMAPSPANHLPPSNATEIKREVIDNSYFESVNVDVLRDFLATTNPNGSINTSGFEGFNSDIWKDILNDGGLGDDGLAGANFGDEDFITKFLEDINNDSIEQQKQEQQMICNLNKPQPVINNVLTTNASNLIINNTPVNTTTYNNRNQYTNESQVISNYQPIQPRMTNTTSNATLRPMVNAGVSQVHSLTNNNINANCPMTIAPNMMPNQGLLITQQSMVQGQQQISQMYQQQQQQQQQQPTQVHSILHHQPQQIQLRLPNNAVANLPTAINGQQNLAIQLSITVPTAQQNAQQQQQQQQQQPQQSSQPPAASIALKQMAQQAQQKNQPNHWVMNNATTVLQQNNTQQPTIIQQNQLQQVNQQKMPNQYFNSQQQQQQQPQQQQQQQHTYWQPQQQHQQQHLQVMQTQQQIMQIPQQSQPKPPQQQPQPQHQFHNNINQQYWQQQPHPQQQGQQQMITVQQQQPMQPQQQQIYYNNYNNFY